MIIFSCGSNYQPAHYKTRRSQKPMLVTIKVIATKLCPVKTVIKFFNMRGKKHGPLFVLCNCKPVFTSKFNKMFKFLLHSGIILALSIKLTVRVLEPVYRLCYLGSQRGVSCILVNGSNKVAKISNRYNQVTHLTQDTNGKVTNSQKTPQTRAKRSALSQQVTTKHI